MGHAEPADSSDSAAGSTNKGPGQGQAKQVPPVQVKHHAGTNYIHVMRG